MTKSELLANIRQARADWEAALAQLDDPQILHPGTGGWSLKDVIAHITWHEREMIGVAQAHALVGSEMWGWPLDERNHAIYLSNKDRSLVDVRQEAGQVYPQLLQALDTLSDDELSDPARFPGMPQDWQPWKLIAENTYEHYLDHLADLQAGRM